MACFLLKYDILTKTRTYISLELRKFFISPSLENLNHNLSKRFCGINIMPMVFGFNLYDKS